MFSFNLQAGPNFKLVFCRTCSLFLVKYQFLFPILCEKVVKQALQLRRDTQQSMNFD